MVLKSTSPGSVLSLGAWGTENYKDSLFLYKLNSVLTRMFSNEGTSFGGNMPQHGNRQRTLPGCKNSVESLESDVGDVPFEQPEC